MRIRADFARYGWSIERDLGRRLRYADALALHECISADPATYTGAGNLGLAFPMGASDIVQLAVSGGSKLLGDISGDEQPAEITEDERLAAEATMSRMFD